MITYENKLRPTQLKSLFTVKYEMIYQIDAIEYLFVFFQLDMFRAYTPIFSSNGC